MTSIEGFSPWSLSEIRNPVGNFLSWPTSEAVKEFGRERIVVSDGQLALNFNPEAKLRHRKKREFFVTEAGDWTKADEGGAPDFLKPGLSVREYLRREVNFGERKKGPMAESYQSLLDEAASALIPYLDEVVTGTRSYRKELAKQLRGKKVADAENLDDETFLRAIVSGEILNNYEDFRKKRSEDYLMILSISQAIRLSAVELMKSWVDSGKITKAELDHLSMTSNELSVVMDLELKAGPVQNAIFNKLVYQQAALGGRMPGRWGERIFNMDEVLGKLFLHTWQEKKGGKNSKLTNGEKKPSRGGKKRKGEKYFTYKLRSRDFLYPEWLHLADVFNEFVPSLKNRLSSQEWETNWEGIERYFSQLDVVMRSNTLDRVKIDEEYEKLYRIAREINPKVRFLLLPPTMEDSSLSIDGMFSMLWQSDKDRHRTGEYAKLTPLFQETINTIELLRPGLVSRLDLIATVGIAGTLLNVSGQTSESRLQGGRIWRRRAQIHDEVIDKRTDDYRWPLLVRTGLVRKNDLRLLAELKEAVKWYMLSHEKTHGVIPDYKRGAIEELKCDLFGLDRLINHLGGVDNIPYRMRRALVLAVISEDLYNLSSSSAEPGSLGSLYLVPSVLRMNRLMKAGFISIDGGKIRIKRGNERGVLDLLARKWGKEEIMEELYLWARKNTANPSDKTMLKEIAKILRRNHDLDVFVRVELPKMLKVIGDNI